MQKKSEENLYPFVHKFDGIETILVCSCSEFLLSELGVQKSQKNPGASPLDPANALDMPCGARGRGPWTPAPTTASHSRLEIVSMFAFRKPRSEPWYADDTAFRKISQRLYIFRG